MNSLISIVIIAIVIIIIIVFATQQNQQSSTLVKWSKPNDSDIINNDNLYDYCESNSKVKLMVRYPSGMGHDKNFAKIFKQYGEILFTEVYYVKKPQLRKLIAELYRGHQFLTPDKIDDKVDKCWRKDGKVIMHVFKHKSHKLNKLKKHIRKSLFHGHRSALHTTDYHDETLIRLRFIFNQL